MMSVKLLFSKFLDETSDIQSIIIVPNTDLSKNKIYNFTYAKELADEDSDNR